MSPRPALLRASIVSALVSISLLATGCGGSPEGDAASSSGQAQVQESADPGNAEEGASSQDPSSGATGANEEDAAAGEADAPGDPSPESDVTGEPSVVVPQEILEAAAVPALGNLTSVTQRGNGSEATWALRYGLGKTPWEKTCADYEKSLVNLGFDEAFSETNSLYASGTYLGKEHSVSYSCEKGSMVVLVGPGW